MLKRCFFFLRGLGNFYLLLMPPEKFIDCETTLLVLEASV